MSSIDCPALPQVAAVDGVVAEGFMSKFGVIKQTRVTRIEIFLLAASAILSGQVTAWNGATTEGFWVLMWACVMNTVGYVILTCCIAEMTSALPFSGGIYGFVRAFTLPVLGFMVAVFELMMNLFYVSPVVYTLASLPYLSSVMSHNMILVVCFLVYVFILGVLLIGGKLFWMLTKSLGAMIVVLILVFIIGSCTYADFDAWGRGKHGESFNGFEFMKQIPLVSTLYLGMQMIPLTARCAPDPKKDVPIMMNISMIVFAVLSFGLITTAVSQFPGIDRLTGRATPLSPGFSRIFRLSIASARWISAPFLFATAFAFIFFCGRQASCMAKSGLIPEMFNRTIPVLDTPYVSLITFCLLSFLLNIVIYHNEDLLRNMYLVTALSSFIVYIAALVGYIRFHHKYSSLERYFKSPFGVWGAYIGIMIFGCCFIGGALFQYDRFVSIGIIVVTGLLAFLYFLFLSGEHVFSEEEKQELFKAYLVNANLATKKRIQQRMKIAKPPLAPATKQVIPTLTSQTTSVAASRNSVDSADPFTKPTDEKKDIENAVQLCLPDLSGEEPVTTSGKVSKKSLSQKIISFFSSKIHQIFPEAAEDSTHQQQLEILQAGESIIVKEVDGPNIVENLELQQLFLPIMSSDDSRNSFILLEKSFSPID